MNTSIKKAQLLTQLLPFNEGMIDPGVFKVPSKGFVTRKFYINSSSKSGKKFVDETDQETDKEEER